MRKAFIYILLPIFMFNSSLGELFKLPELLSHFSEHQARNKNISLFDFLSMHYIGNDLDNTDQDRDMQLPFKKIDEYFSFQIASFPNSRFIPENRFEVIDTYQQILFKSNRSKDPALASLFRPPCT